MARQIALKDISESTSIKGGFITIYNDNNDEISYDINALYTKVEELEEENASLKKQVANNRAKIDALTKIVENSSLEETSANYTSIMQYLNYITSTLKDAGLITE